MLGRRQKLKYEAVDNINEDVTVDLEPSLKRKIFTPACLWSSLSTTLLIGIYFAPSIGLTFYQRWLYQTFHFPLSTVLVHMIVKYQLAALVRCLLTFKHGKQRLLLGWKDYIISVGPTGFFSGIDIGFSNWGLELITVSLYTMTKSTSIVFILGFSILFKLEKKSWSLCTIVIMIALGLVLVTYKATQFNMMGFVLVLVASMSSGLRWTCVQMLLQKSKMGMKNPIDMIYHMQPFMIASLLPFAMFIEGPSLIKHCQLLRSKETSEFTLLLTKVLIGSFIAFFMELSEVIVVTYTSSLTLSIAGIFKELFILVLAVELNGDTMSELNIVGLFVCLCGITSHVIHKIRTTSMHLTRSFEFDASDHTYGMGQALMSDHDGVDQMSLSTESEGENDSQVLFNILNRRER